MEIFTLYSPAELNLADFTVTAQHHSTASTSSDNHWPGYNVIKTMYTSTPCPKQSAHHQLSICGNGNTDFSVRHTQANCYLGMKLLGF